MSLLNKIKLDKKVIIIIGIIGVVFMLLGGGGNDKKAAITDEERLVNILSHIEGAGEIKVMLSLNYNSEYMFNKTDDSKYIGAVILAEGGGKSIVREKIIKAVQVVTGLETHKIVVYRLD